MACHGAEVCTVAAPPSPTRVLACVGYEVAIILGVTLLPTEAVVVGHLLRIALIALGAAPRVRVLGRVRVLYPIFG